MDYFKADQNNIQFSFSIIQYSTYSEKVENFNIFRISVIDNIFKNHQQLFKLFPIIDKYM